MFSFIFFFSSFHLFLIFLLSLNFSSILFFCFLYIIVSFQLSSFSLYLLPKLSFFSPFTFLPLLFHFILLLIFSFSLSPFFSTCLSILFFFFFFFLSNCCHYCCLTWYISLKVLTYYIGWNQFEIPKFVEFLYRLDPKRVEGKKNMKWWKSNHSFFFLYILFIELLSKSNFISF